MINNEQLDSFFSNIDNTTDYEEEIRMKMWSGTTFHLVI